MLCKGGGSPVASVFAPNTGTEMVLGVSISGAEVKKGGHRSVLHPLHISNMERMASP